MKKRILSIVMIIMMLVSMMPVSAEDTDLYMGEAVHVHEDGEVCTCEEHEHCTCEEHEHCTCEEHELCTCEQGSACACSDGGDCICDLCECADCVVKTGEEGSALTDVQEELPEQAEELLTEEQNEETPVVTEETETQEESPVSEQPEEEPEQITEQPAEEQNEEAPVITEETETQEESPVSEQPEEEPEQVTEQPAEEQNEEAPVITEETEAQEEPPVSEQPEEENVPAFSAAPMMLMSAMPEECSHPEASWTYTPLDQEFHAVHCTECDTDMGNYSHFWVADQDLGNGMHSIKCRDCGFEADWCNSHIVYCNTTPGVCADCGAVLPDGYPVEHVLNRKDNGDGTHTLTCQNCSYFVTEDHFADCRSGNKTKCDECEFVSENDLPVRHMSMGVDWDSEGHYDYCFACGTEFPETKEAHAADESVWYTDENWHYQKCAYCEYQMNYGSHNNCDESATVCFACGKSSETDGIRLEHWHNTRTEYVDQETHQYVCLQCNEVTGTASHRVTCEDPTVCSECGATGLSGYSPEHVLDHRINEDGTHTKYCQYCSYEEKEAHYSACWSNDRKQCSACGKTFDAELPVTHMSLGWTSDDDTHYQQCGNCGEVIEGTDEEHDIDYTVWVTNEDGHYHACSKCGYSVDYEPHINCKGENTCLVCGESGDGIRISGDHHRHYEYVDAEHHVEVCEFCDMQFNINPHSVSCTEPGACLECGAAPDQMTDPYADHQYSGKFKECDDGLHHVMVCDVCGKEDTYKYDHEVSCKDPTVCIHCGATGLTGFEVRHELTIIDNKNGTHTRKCVVEGCGYEEEPEAHYLSCGDPDADCCRACAAELTGETEVRHESIEYSFDETGHWEHCWACGKDFEETRQDHNISEGWDYDECNHFHSCTVCDYRCDSQMHLNCTGGSACLICGCEDPINLDTNHQSDMHYVPEWDGYGYDYYPSDTDPARHYLKCKYCDTLYDGQYHNVDMSTGKCTDCKAEVKFCENDEDHSWIWVSDINNHHLVCELCSQTKGDWGEHHDCDKNGKCDICDCELTSEFLWKEDHDYQLVPDDTQHWMACKYCGELAEGSVREDHSFVQKSDEQKHWQECELCGYRTNEEEHKAANDWSMDPDGISHWKACEVCGEIVTSTWEEHDAQWQMGEETHQKSCSVCGYVSGEVEHEFNIVIAVDDEQHTLACECGKEKPEAHQGSSWWEDDYENGKSIHYSQCDVCRKMISIEGELHENLPWTYDAEGHHQICPVENCDWNTWNNNAHVRNCNGTPGVCGDPDCTYTGPIDDSTMCLMHEFEFTAKDAYAHTGKCQYCDVEILEPHWDEDGDGICESCGYGEQDGDTILMCVLHTADKMEYDQSNHWYVCTTCGQYFDWSSHGSCTGGDQCDLCGMSRDECAFFIDDHCYITSSVHDNQYHYLECVFCGKTERSEHFESCTKPGVCGDEICGATAEEGAVFTILAHNYSPSDVQFDEYSHWYVCRDCGQTVDKYSHWSENGFYCSNCDIEMSEVKVCEEHDIDDTDLHSDEWGHYYVCMICGDSVEWEGHYNCDPEADACAICGRAKEECSQFSVEHMCDYDVKPVNVDAYSHARICSYCGEPVILESHWMYWDDATQSYYCEACGATDLELHACQFDGWQSSANGLYHYRECELCHNMWDYETHVDDDGDGICDVCELKATICHHENGYSPFWSSDNKSYAHYVECKYCHEWYGEEPHVDANGDHVCDLCGQSDIAICTSHTWAKDENGKYSYWYDDETHYVYCEKCRTKGTVTEHIWSDWVASPEGHMRSCKACKYQQWENHSLCGGSKCKVCGQPKSDCTSYMDHWYDVVDNGSDETHLFVCRYCGDKQENPHGRSCTDPKGVCSSCGHVMDDSLMDIWHMTNNKYESDGFYHWQVCLYCGEQVYKYAHWDYNNDGYCDDTSCGAEIEPCPGHDFGDWTVEGTWNHMRTCAICGTVEYETHYNCSGGDTCLACGIKKASDVYLETYHMVEDYEKLESDAYYHWNVCSRCGEPQNKTTHWDGNYDGVCDQCGNIIGHDHTWTLSETVKATCTADGKYVYVCGCGMTREDSIDKLGHDYQLSATSEATCVAQGANTYTCTRCTASYSEAISGLKEHTWVISGKTDPTCLAAGATHYQCAVCSATKDEAIPAVAEHNWVLKEEVPSTCEKLGHKVFSCTICSSVRNEDLTEYAEHNWVLKEEVPSTCTMLGHKVFTCTTCGSIRSEDLTEYADHNWVLKEEVPSTCTEAGHREYVCGVCNASRTVQLALAEHDWVETDRLDASCTEDGYADYECAACGTTRHDVLPALGHSYGTYTTGYNGTHSRTCSVCAHVDVENCQWTTVEIGNITISTCNICRFVKTTITGLEDLNKLGKTNTTVAKEIRTENVKVDMDLSAFMSPDLDPEDPEQTPVETHLTITESSEALPENCSVVKMFNINLEVNGEALSKVDQKVVISLPLSNLSDMSEIEKDVENYKLFVLSETGELIAVEYEIVDGMLILSTEAFGMFVMMTAEEAALLTK